jgi:hypothetical protein
MNVKRAAFAMVALAALGCAQKPVVFQSPGNYAITFPGSHGKVKSDNMNFSSAHGAVVATVHMGINDFASIGLMMAMHMDLPNGARNSRSDEQIMDDCMNGAVKNVGCRITEGSTVVYKTFAAKEGSFEGNYKGKNMFGKTRCFFINERVVLLLYAGLDKKVLASADGKMFLESFDWKG